MRRAASTRIMAAPAPVFLIGFLTFEAGFAPMIDVAFAGDVVCGNTVMRQADDRFLPAAPLARTVTSRTVAAKPIRSINSIKTNGEEPNRGRL
jgi:hypothetical protein